MASEILRPNAAGDVTQLTPLSGTNWSNVDEVSPDDDASYVFCPLGEDKYDLYNLPAHSAGPGVINYITVYARCKKVTYAAELVFKIKTLGTEFHHWHGYIGTAYFESSHRWYTNPLTGEAWTWPQIDALQIGIRLLAGSTSTARCTQVYVEVFYIPAPPEAPTNVQATDGVHSDKVVITWTKSTGATGYQVYRDGVGLGWLGDVATFNDAGAGAPSITPGSSVATDGDHTDKIALSLAGTGVNNGTVHTYKVRARNVGGESVDSATDTGYRAPGSLTYQWQRSGADIDGSYSNISGATAATYDDTDAPAPTIAPGSASASDGTSVAHVALSLSGQSANNGAGRYYRCVLNASGCAQQTSTANRGYRGVGALTYQWQRSAGDSDASYTNIPGATTADYNDIGAPADGSGRYYRCVENATGAAQAISSADRGYRITSPTVTTEPVSNIGNIGATGNATITDDGGEACSERGVCWNTTGNPTTADSKSAQTDSFGVGAFTRLMTGLTPGQLYYVKGYAINSAGTSYGGQVSFTTKPSAPSNLTATTISETQIDLAWTKGAGAVNTVIRRRVNAAPISITDGVEVYNGPGTSHNDTTCSPGVHYFYRAWSYHPTSGYSDNYDTADSFTTVAPTGTTEAATLIGDVNATLNGKVTDDGGEPCQVRFQYGLTAAYGYNTAWQTGKVTADTFLQRITGLTQLTTYHFRAQIKNSAGTANGVDRTFTTIELPTPFLRRVLRDVFGEGADIDKDNPLQVYDPKVFESLVVYEGTATADGPDTSTITDTVLATKPDFNGQLVVITSGSYKGQTRDIDQATDEGGGKVHAAKAFDGTIVSGVTYKILSIRPTTAEVADIETKCDAIKTQTDKLAGEAPAEDSVTKNWNTAVDSPDGAGGLLVNLGTAATRKKLHSLLLDVSALTDGAIIHVKLFIKINDTQRKVYDETFTIAIDPDGLWIVNGTVGLHDVLSVAVYSDNNESKAIGYTAMLEAM